MNNGIRIFAGIALLALSLVMPLAPASTAAAAPTPAYTFSTIDYPGAVMTNVWGMNAGGSLVGYYRNAQGPTHGFVLSEGIFSTVDFPGSIATTLVGIGPSGEIVGDYLLPNGPAWGAWQSFRLTTEGDFVDANYPGYLSTIPIRVLPDGTIIGFARDADPASKHGVTMGPKGMSEYNLPNSQHNGATPNGKVIVGHYVTAGITRGYILDKGEFASFDVPGSTLTMAYDISPSGDVVVGTYVDASNKAHGFVVERRGATVSDWEFTKIDFPGATATRVWTANAAGDLAGHYVDAAGRYHGFLARRAED